MRNDQIVLACLAFCLAISSASAQDSGTAKQNVHQPAKTGPAKSPLPAPSKTPEAQPEELSSQAMVEEQERRDRKEQAERDRDDQARLTQNRAPTG